MLTLALALVLSGAIAGLLAGLFGIGGGAILVPVMVQALALLDVDEAIRMHLAVATSLGIVVPTSIRSFMAHRKHGAVDMPLLKSWAIVLPVGAILASAVAAVISGASLKWIFTAIATVVGIKMLINKPGWVVAQDLPGQPVRSLYGLLIGFFSTLMGIGGGIMNNTFMMLYNQPIKRAVATSSGVGVLISIPAVIGLIIAGWHKTDLPAYSLGYVNMLAVALIMPISLLTAPLGARMAHAASKRTLELSFGVFLLAVSAQFAWALLA
ncbi:putative membrane protein YfcA [Aminobacter lissarensis]|uniref:Probable membrane transporter protein n=1 Tax=Aminobacter carboxidus TaxID=376165 RepID=A0A8E1WHS0_9HYPH|nr:sulfite exporter TauE/SafE family protein [Aminobacter lissarensis]MBB6468134.1 putative membrane protein YfcA [Aminobacter lissarensis]